MVSWQESKCEKRVSVEQHMLEGNFERRYRWLLSSGLQFSLRMLWMMSDQNIPISKLIFLHNETSGRFYWIIFSRKPNIPSNFYSNLELSELHCRKYKKTHNLAEYSKCMNGKDWPSSLKYVFCCDPACLEGRNFIFIAKIFTFLVFITNVFAKWLKSKS